MANFSGSLISATFNRLLQLDGNLQDGTGSIVTELPISSSFSLTTTSASHALQADNAISASYAISASHEIIKEVSSSYADTASYVETAQTASYIIGSNVDGIVDSASLATDAISSSIAITSSFSLFSISSSQAATASFLLGSVATASYVETAQTASYIELSNVTGSASIATRLENLETNTGDFATTGSNYFSGSQTFSGSLFPDADEIYDLGSPTKKWKDIYLSSASIYLNDKQITIADGSLVVFDSGSSTPSPSNLSGSFSGSLFGTATTSSFTLTASFVEPDFISASAAASGFTGTPSGSISSSQQISDLGFISTSGSSQFSGSTSFEGDTSFTGSTVMSGSLISQGNFRAEGDHVLTGSVIIDGGFTVEGSTPTAINTDVNLSGSLTQIGDSVISGSLTTTGGFTGSLQGTSSVSLDTLLLDGKDSATFATTGSNTFKASQYISGSVVIAPSADPGTGNLNATYLFTSASNFSEDECDFYYRNKGTLWDQEWLEYGVGSGLIYGGVVTFSGTDLFVSPGGGLVVNYNAETGSANAVVPTQVKWGPITSSATYLTSSQYSHLYIDENGDLQQQIEDFTTTQYLEKIPLGTLGHLTNAYIDAFGEEKQTTYAGPAQANQFIRAFGPLKQQGYDLSAITSSLGFNAASGITYKLGGFYSKDPNNPSIYDTPALASTGKVVRVYQSGSEFIGDINAGNFYDTIDPTKYDDGSGTLTTISGSTTTIQRVFIGPTSERFYVYYGQDTYDSVATALNNLTTEQFTESLTTSKSLTFIGYLVVKADTTDLSDETSANIINAGLFRNTAGSSGGGTSTISNLGDITDVNITSPVAKQYLEYDAGIWRNRTIQYDDINASGAGIISSSAQLESLGVSVSSGSTTTFDTDVVISGSNLTVTGSVNVRGSLTSPVITISPSFKPLGWTVEIDPTQGNFFETTLRNGSVNNIDIVNASADPGQTINIKINQNATSAGTINWSSNVKFAEGGISGSSTGLSEIDVFSLVTWNDGNYYATGLKNFS